MAIRSGGCGGRPRRSTGRAVPADGVPTCAFRSGRSRRRTARSELVRSCTSLATSLSAVADAWPCITRKVTPYLSNTGRSVPRTKVPFSDQTSTHSGCSCPSSRPVLCERTRRRSPADRAMHRQLRRALSSTIHPRSESGSACAHERVRLSRVHADWTSSRSGQQQTTDSTRHEQTPVGFIKDAVGGMGSVQRAARAGAAATHNFCRRCCRASARLYALAPCNARARRSPGKTPRHEAGSASTRTGVVAGTAAIASSGSVVCARASAAMTGRNAGLFFWAGCDSMLQRGARSVVRDGEVQVAHLDRLQRAADRAHVIASSTARRRCVGISELARRR